MPRNAARDSSTPAPRQLATYVTLSAALLAEAEALGVDLSQASARGIEAEIAALKAQQWREANAGLVDQWNALVDRHGLPLTDLRQF